MTASSFVCSLVADTRKDGIVDVTQAYNKIINSIKAAEEAAKTAEKAANDTWEVRDAFQIRLAQFFVGLCPACDIGVCVFRTLRTRTSGRSQTL